LVQASAVDAGGWVFRSWAGATDSTNRTVDILMDADKSLRPVQQKQIGTITTQGGRIEVAPLLVDEFENVRVTAIPDDGYYFAAWGAFLSGSKNPEHFRVLPAEYPGWDQPINVSA